MFKRLIATLVSISMLLACTPTRQIALDYPSNQVGESNSAQSIESISFLIVAYCLLRSTIAIFT